MWMSSSSLTDRWRSGGKLFEGWDNSPQSARKIAPSNPVSPRVGQSGLKAGAA
jgi:hypothetical protein